MLRSLPVLLLVLSAQLTQLGAGVAAALSAPEPCPCCTAEAEGGGVAADVDQWRAIAPCGPCGADDGACAAGCGDCRCCAGPGGVATPPVAAMQLKYTAPAIELVFDLVPDPATRVPDTLERPPRSPAPTAGRRQLDR